MQEKVIPSSQRPQLLQSPRTPIKRFVIIAPRRHRPQLPDLSSLQQDKQPKSKHKPFSQKHILAFLKEESIPQSWKFVVIGPFDVHPCQNEAHQHHRINIVFQQRDDQLPGHQVHAEEQGQAGSESARVKRSVYLYHYVMRRGWYEVKAIIGTVLGRGWSWCCWRTACHRYPVIMNGFSLPTIRSSAGSHRLAQLTPCCLPLFPTLHFQQARQAMLIPAPALLTSAHSPFPMSTSKHSSSF